MLTQSHSEIEISAINSNDPQKSTVLKFHLKTANLVDLLREYQGKLQDNLKDGGKPPLYSTVLKEWHQIASNAKAYFLDKVLACSTCGRTHWESYAAEVQETLESLFRDMKSYIPDSQDQESIAVFEIRFGEVKKLADLREKDVRGEGLWICKPSWRYSGIAIHAGKR